ncbi:L-idonate 5-dehydrogenase [Ruegeria aquimaris]|uniref:L-idonate 5-dehydrogenase n=1 Tax=Ruegeria aquimaris TaxID=2984333 RepID=A0ABT3AF13_9RHOB|nr:L-idonate 5-dehydrogenase [Ruegeria sp. XHP0148]MCV2886831.1 L-idonate 5-dehydrogenase [Ruegeria sp. XHP0148]
MRAVVLHAPHDLRVETRTAPDPIEGMVQVRIEAGGICGSDLHYYQHGGFGSVRMIEPMILGHEVAGRVLSAPGECGLEEGDLVAVSPSRNCGTCQYCRAALEMHCENMRFYGSAMPVPHIQGAFRDVILARPDQCHKLPAYVPPTHAACAEPLAVVLHALERAGPLEGRRVLVTGCGPIGALVLLAAKAAGAAEVVVTDVMTVALERARTMGADRALDATQPGWNAEFAKGKGCFDVMFEATGVASAFNDGLACLRPRGVMVMLGLGGEIGFNRNLAIAREIDLRGSFRFHHAFGDAVSAIASGRIDVTPILSGSFPLSKAREAFDLAGDRTQSMKVHLDFST